MTAITEQEYDLLEQLALEMSHHMTRATEAIRNMEKFLELSFERDVEFMDLADRWARIATAHTNYWMLLKNRMLELEGQDDWLGPTTGSIGPASGISQVPLTAGGGGYTTTSGGFTTTNAPPVWTVATSDSTSGDDTISYHQIAEAYGQTNKKWRQAK